MKVGGDQVVLIPRLSIFGGDASHGSHRVVAPMGGSNVPDNNQCLVSCLTGLRRFTFIKSTLIFECFVLFDWLIDWLIDCLFV